MPHLTGKALRGHPDGHPLWAAATCMVVTVPGGPSAEERHVLTVIPEGRQADLARVARQPGGTPARLAGGAVAETLTGYRAPACPEVVPGAEPAPAAGIA